ncbi:MAG: hypothetical protein ACQR33_01720 [Candidatus Saccharibacteria bacterium]
MSTISLQDVSTKRETYFILYGFGALLLVVAAALWWTKVSVNPQRVFWNTVSNSMSTAGVTLHINENNTGTSDQQAIQYSLGTTNLVHSLRTVTQGKTVVKTESVGTATKSFTRYTEVATDQKTVNLKSVLGVWADPTSNGTTAQLLPQVALGLALPLGAVPMPIGYISADQRASIIHDMQLRSLYQVDFTKVKKQTQDGRLLYTYDVQMQPELYLDTFKIFAQDAGLNDLKNIDTSQYSGTTNVKVSLTIDARAQQLVKVVSTDQGYQESYDGYGVSTQVAVPTRAISLTDLQTRLSGIQ